MANQSKLKAWVRIDGGGTVVGSGPIFSLKKPKVGKWREMNANLCCNTTPTTTTTTTAGGQGGIPTAWVVSMYASENNACIDAAQGTTIIYTQGNTIGIGTTIWQDAALTIPFSNFNTYCLKFLGDSNIYTFTSMQTSFIIGIVSCPVYQIYCNLAFDEATACSGVGGFSNFPVYSTTQFINYGTQLYLNAALTQPYSGGTWGNYVKPVSGNYAYYVPQNTVENFGTSCP